MTWTADDFFFPKKGAVTIAITQESINRAEQIHFDSHWTPSDSSNFFVAMGFQVEGKPKPNELLFGSVNQVDDHQTLWRRD